MDLAAVGAMVLGEGHHLATLQVVTPPTDPRATEAPVWTAELKSAADEAFTEYRAEAGSVASKPDPSLAQALMVIGAGVAALRHLVHEGRPALPKEELDEEEGEECAAEQNKGNQPSPRV